MFCPPVDLSVGNCTSERLCWHTDCTIYNVGRDHWDLNNVAIVMLCELMVECSSVVQVLDGGLRDKPGKSPDYYHTCYCLSGLTQAQSSASHRLNAPPPPMAVLGPYSNLLEPVHPLCNVDLNKYNDAVRYFRQRPFQPSSVSLGSWAPSNAHLAECLCYIYRLFTSFCSSWIHHAALSTLWLMFLLWSIRLAGAQFLYILKRH
jgi:hypothetical protein